MKNFVTLLFIVLLNNLVGQEEIKYNDAPHVSGAGYEIDCKDILSTAEYCKFKLIAENISQNNYLVLDLKKVGFEYDGIGLYYPDKGKEMVILPEIKESKVIKVDGQTDYRVAAFSLRINGLKSGAISANPVLPKLNIEAGTPVKIESEGITLNCEKSSAKKGKVSANLEIVFEGNADQLMVVDPAMIKVINSAGTALVAEVEKNEKVALRPGDKHQLKLNFESEETTFVVTTENCFGLVNLTTVNLDKIPVVSSMAMNNSVAVNNTSNGNVSSAAVNCTPFKGPAEGSVQVKIQADETPCFKLDIDGFPIVTDFAGAAIIYRNPGRCNMKFTLPNGTVVEKSVFIADTYDVIGYRLKEKGSGEYVVKYVAGDQVLNSKGEQQRSEMMARTKAMTESHKTVETETSGNSNAQDGSASSGGGGCFGEASSGTTTVKLKITWKGAPVAGHDIQIKIGGAAIGNNVTNSSGDVSIKTSSLNANKIDVYGCKGNSNWSITGDWVVLDGSNYFHLKLEEVAAFMGEMMGMTVDEIGAGWGM